MGGAVRRAYTSQIEYMPFLVYHAGAVSGQQSTFSDIELTGFEPTPWFTMRSAWAGDCNNEHRQAIKVNRGGRYITVARNVRTVNAQAIYHK